MIIHVKYENENLPCCSKYQVSSVCSFALHRMCIEFANTELQSQTCFYVTDFSCNND